MQPRKQVSARTRFEVFKRDSFTCQYCGASPPNVVLHADHITAVSNGGKNTKDNLITSCSSCNLGKSNVPLSSIPQSLADKAREVQEREAQIKAFRAAIQAQEDREKDDAWGVVRALYGEGCDSINRLHFQSIQNFLRKLPLDVVVNAARGSWVKSGKLVRFKYFCGICWNRIKDGGANA